MKPICYKIMDLNPPPLKEIAYVSLIIEPLIGTTDLIIHTNI